MIVYRVEDDFGGGPYNGPRAPQPFTKGWHTIINDAENGVNDPVSQPNPVDDLQITLLDYHFKFGFSTVDQVVSWFKDKAREYLRDRGYWLAHYEVPENYTLVGGHQVAFDRRHAKLVKRVALPAASQIEMDFTKSSKRKRQPRLTASQK